MTISYNYMLGMITIQSICINCWWSSLTYQFDFPCGDLHAIKSGQNDKTDLNTHGVTPLLCEIFIPVFLGKSLVPAK